LATATSSRANDLQSVEAPALRRRPFGSYLIFYRVGTETVEVVHILHGARDYEPLLFPEG
jgi:toxin ParE1/3/4